MSDLPKKEVGLKPGESAARNSICDALTQALVYIGNLAYEANERYTLNLRNESDVRALARLLTTRDPDGRDGSLGENTRLLWEKIGAALRATATAERHAAQKSESPHSPSGGTTP
jgi:hypothetical protein